MFSELTPPVITVTGLAARMLETDDGREIEEQPIPYTLTPLALAALSDPEACQ
jgi:hypothetical protein